jgi:hypothetical protein
MHVSSWLRDLGLANYTQAFRVNDIDAEVLPRLTAEDLMAIGVSSVGHRRKLLGAIAPCATRARRRLGLPPLAAPTRRRTSPSRRFPTASGGR